MAPLNCQSVGASSLSEWHCFMLGVLHRWISGHILSLNVRFCGRERAVTIMYEDYFPIHHR